MKKNPAKKTSRVEDAKRILKQLTGSEDGRKDGMSSFNKLLERAAKPRRR